MFIVFWVPLFELLALLVLVANPAFVELAIRDWSLFLEQTRAVLGFVAVDSSWMAGCLAFGGLLLAVNKLEHARIESGDKEITFRILAVAEFRQALQLIGVVGTAMTPGLAILWVGLHAGEPGWERDSVAIAAGCCGLWIVLVLVMPESTPFGLEAAKAEWSLRHLVYRKDALEQQFSCRWGQNLSASRPSGRSRPVLRFLAAWAIITLGLCALLFSLTALVEGDFSWLSLPSSWTILLFLSFYIYALAAIGLGAAVLRLSFAVRSRGFSGISKLCVAAAFALPLPSALFFSGSFMPGTVVAWLAWAIQTGALAGLTTTKAPARAWSLLRPLVLPVQDFILNHAHDSWKSLDHEIQAQLKELPARKARKTRREIAAWQTNSRQSRWLSDEKIL